MVTIFRIIMQITRALQHSELLDYTLQIDLQCYNLDKDAENVNTPKEKVIYVYIPHNGYYAIKVYF